MDACVELWNILDRNQIAQYFSAITLPHIDHSSKFKIPSFIPDKFINQEEVELKKISKGVDGEISMKDFTKFASTLRKRIKDYKEKTITMRLISPTRLTLPLETEFDFPTITKLRNTWKNATCTPEGEIEEGSLILHFHGGG